MSKCVSESYTSTAVHSDDDEGDTSLDDDEEVEFSEDEEQADASDRDLVQEFFAFTPPLATGSNAPFLRSQGKSNVLNTVVNATDTEEEIEAGITHVIDRLSPIVEV